MNKYITSYRNVIIRYLIMIEMKRKNYYSKKRKVFLYKYFVYLFNIKEKRIINYSLFLYGCFPLIITIEVIKCLSVNKIYT